ncbi:MAG: hypothetical protein WDO73_02790 [Ignavibacteriota bacterium]
MGLATTTGGVGSTTPTGGGRTVEVPTGTMDGLNSVFTLSVAPSAGSLVLLVNGIEQNPGTGTPIDYVLVGLTITFVAPPRADDWMLASYTT